MECCIKYCNHRNTGHNLLTSSDTDKVCRVVKRCKIANFLDSLNNFIVNNNGFSELLSAVNNTMSYCSDLIKRHNTVFFIGKSVDYKLDRSVMIGHG